MTTAPLLASSYDQWLTQAEVALQNKELHKAYEANELARTCLDKLQSKTHDQYLQIARQLFSTRDVASFFVTPDNKPTMRLIALLTLDGLYDEKDTLADIVCKTQKNWIQVQQGANGKERPDLKDDARRIELRHKVEELATELGLFETRAPLLKRYDYGICLGAFLDGVRSRVKELVDQWQSGVRFDSLIFLTGQRYLRKAQGQEDSIEKLTNPAQSPLPFKANWKLAEDAKYETEYDLCRIVWEQSEIPEEMQKALAGKVVFVNAPRPHGKERPSTKDTYEKWLNEYQPKPGTVLAISHPMLWSYQQLTGENMLGPDFPLDTCAKAATAQVRLAQKERIVSLVEDTIAKCLYEISQRKKAPNT